MSTKVAVSKAETDQARATLVQGLKAVASSLAQVDTKMRMDTVYATTWAVARPAFYQVSEKAAEAGRQVERVKSLSYFYDANDPENSEALDSIASSIALIGSFLTSPLPIPVASSGQEGGTTLFLEGDEFYGDLEIKGKTVEYYLKASRRGCSIEVFDTEEIRDGYIPPRLLTCLYAHFAR